MGNCQRRMFCLSVRASNNVLMKSDHILVFGAGVLQKSLINCCKKLNLFVVLIDPNPEAEARDMGDAFVTVDGNDFNATCSVVEQYSITGIVTAATDKPL